MSLHHFLVEREKLSRALSVSVRKDHATYKQKTIMSTQQSWGAWLLDAYTSSVSPTLSEPSHISQEDNSESDYDPGSPSTSQSSPTMSSSLPFGPYVKTGRGGAGNFTWQSQQNINPEDKLEAQKPSTLIERRKAASRIEHLDTSEAMRNRAAQRSASQYIRVGRGFVQSNEIQQSPRSISMPIDLPSTPISATPTSAVPSGRGGAGNFAAAAANKEREEAEKQTQARLEAEKTRERITEQVESKLMPPPDAWLGGRRRNLLVPEDDMV